MKRTLHTPTGRRRVSFYGATAEEANNKKFQALADQTKGVLFSDPGRLTVAEHLTRWLQDTARYQVSEGSFERYERVVRIHLVPFFRSLRLRDLTPAHIRAFKARKLGEGLNPNTVGSMPGVLSVALNRAVDDGLIASNPASRVKEAAKRGEPPMRALTNEEASRLVAAARGTRDEALIMLALKTGMRQGELAALRWEDLDLSGPRPTVTVRPPPHGLQDARALRPCHDFEKVCPRPRGYARGRRPGDGRASFGSRRPSLCSSGLDLPGLV